MNKPQELIHRDHNQEEFVSDWNNEFEHSNVECSFWL